jgi:hypothetical protein
VWNAIKQIAARVLDRTNISTADKITFANSPIHLRIQNVAKNNTIQSVVVYLWIWNGNQNKVLGTPNATYVKNKIVLMTILISR